MKTKTETSLTGCILLVGLLAFWVGCNQASSPKASQAASLEEEPMEAAYKTDNSSTKIPTIDMAAPAVFETATFGLG